jgi:hypothetical protein
MKLSGKHNLSSYRRPYAYRIQERKSALLTVSLPKSLLDLVATCADQMGASRNETCYKFLQRGLILYMKAQASLLEASMRDWCAHRPTGLRCDRDVLSYITI